MSQVDGQARLPQTRPALNFVLTPSAVFFGELIQLLAGIIADGESVRPHFLGAGGGEFDALGVGIGKEEVQEPVM